MVTGGCEKLFAIHFACQLPLKRVQMNAFINQKKWVKPVHNLESLKNDNKNIRFVLKSLFQAKGSIKAKPKENYLLT